MGSLADRMRRTLRRIRNGCVVLAGVGGFGAGCGPPCDAERLVSEYHAAQQPASPEAALDLLKASCGAEVVDSAVAWAADFDPEAVAKEWKTTWEQACVGSDTLTLPEVPGSLAWRDALFEQCGLETAGLGDAHGFRWAMGRPVLALWVGSWLRSQKIDPEVATGLAMAVRGPAALPQVSDWTPLTLPDWGAPLQAPVAHWVAEQASTTETAGLNGKARTGTRSLAAGDRALYGQLWDASTGVSTLGVVGVLRPPDQAERPASLELTVADRDDRSWTRGLVVWLDQSGVTVYADGHRLQTQKGCGGASLCGIQEQGAAAWTEAALTELVRERVNASRWPEGVQVVAERDVALVDVIRAVRAMGAAHPELAKQVTLLTPGSAPPPIQLTVSQHLRDNLTFLERDHYAGVEVERLFDSMKEPGDQYCEMIHGFQPYVRSRASEFARGDMLKTKGRGLFFLKSGCANFFRMNDLAPYRDFEVVKYLRPNDRFDCYSVGMLQPFMLHNVLGCESLTMVDFDWRILAAQHEMIDLYEQEAFADTDAFDATLASVELRWFAKTEERQARVAGSVNAMCGRHNQEVCRQHMIDFQDNWSGLQNVSLNLAYLHDAEFVDTDATRVMYFSNATERHYTTDKSFKKLVQRLADSMTGEQTALMIHHAGGCGSFGVYSLENAAGKPVVKTLCKDPYYQTALWEKGQKMSEMPVYDIWLDTVTTTPGTPPLCASLIRRAQASRTR